jgi:hypothetical protein
MSPIGNIQDRNFARCLKRQHGSTPYLTSSPCRPGTESIVKFSEIFLLGSRDTTARSGLAGSRSATAAKRLKAYNKTGLIEPKENLVPKLDTALTAPQLCSIFCILHTVVVSARQGRAGFLRDLIAEEKRWRGKKVHEQGAVKVVITANACGSSGSSLRLPVFFVLARARGGI